MALLGYFNRDLLWKWQFFSITFFPWLWVDPAIVLHLKEGPHGMMGHTTDRIETWCRKWRWKKPTEKNFTVAVMRIPDLWIQCQALYPLNDGALPNSNILNNIFLSESNTKSPRSRPSWRGTPSRRRRFRRRATTPLRRWCRRSGSRSQTRTPAGSITLEWAI